MQWGKYLIVVIPNFEYLFVSLRLESRRFMHKIGRNITALALLLLFVGYWSSITLFPHAHHINGRVYVHSHPFADAHPNHTHSQQEFQFIKHLSYLVMTAATVVFFRKQLLELFYTILVPKVFRRQDSPIHVYGLRAPPSVA